MLNSKLKCMNCFLQIPITKNVGFIESVLHMPCLGDGTGHDLQHSLDTTTNQYYLFGRVKVHPSHLMATKVVWVCTFACTVEPMGQTGATV